MSEYQVKVQQSKLEAVQALKEEFGQAKDFIFTDYRGLTVEQITALRNKLRENNAVYKVVKNRYAKIALEQMGLPAVGDGLVGPTAVAMAMDESGPVAKALVEFAEENDLQVKAGIIAGDVFDEAQVAAFSKLPTRLELISSLMGTMKAPVQNVVFVLNAVPTKFVRTLQAVVDKKNAEG